MASGWHRKNPNSPAAQARAREYRTPHYKQARLRAKAQVDAGTARCWRCGRPIPPGSRWHLGHDDYDRTIIRGPEHAVECNLKAAARKGALIANARRRTTRGVTALPM